MTRTSEILSKAADLIEKCGWTQGHWQTEAGELCVDGAICKAANGDAHVDSPESNDAYEAMFGYLREHYEQVGYEDGQQIGGVIGWNDEKGRTREEVLQALREAALL